MTELLDSIKCNDDVILCDVTMYINIAYFLFVPLLIIYEFIELLCCVPVEYFDIVQSIYQLPIITPKCLLVISNYSSHEH